MGGGGGGVRALIGYADGGRGGWGGGVRALIGYADGGRGGGVRLESVFISFLTNTCEREKSLSIDACAFLEQDQLLRELCLNSRLVD